MSSNTTESPITVALDPDPRGVSVGVWQGSQCIYTGAHAVPVAPGDAQDERRMEVLYVAGAICRHLDMALDQSKVMAAARDIAQHFSAPAAGDAQLLAALKQAHMALIGFMPRHRNAVIVNAIVAARGAIDAALAAQVPHKGDAA